MPVRKSAPTETTPAPRKRAVPAVKKATDETTEKLGGPARKPGRRAQVKLNKGSKVHVGVFDIKENVAYCRVLFGADRYGHRGTDLDIVEVDKFIDWLNEKNGKYNGGNRFMKVEVVGADVDQRENAGINKLYEEFFQENEDVRISAALAILFDEEKSYSALQIIKYEGGWRLNSSHDDKGVSGKAQIGRISETAKVSYTKAREVFMERLRLEIGEEMFSRLNFVTEEWAQQVDESRTGALRRILPDRTNLV